MRSLCLRSHRIIVPLVFLTCAIFTGREVASAAQLTLHWADNSTNETGFRLERKVGASGAFGQLTTVGANTTSYIDSALTAGTTYCYRVSAYNAAGTSPSSNEACGSTTPASFSLTVSTTGSGAGTVTATGLNCGADCSESYPQGTSVTLTATPTGGSTFTGWSGDADCTDGHVTMTTNLTCIASFALVFPPPPPSPDPVLSIIKIGNGTVTSSSAGIACGNDCAEAYPAGSTVTLTATPDSGAKFTGWSGGGCSGAGSCLVTVNANLSVTATFTQLAVAKIGVFRPSTGEWRLDDGNGQWDGCGVDTCISSFGTSSTLPVVGDWTGTHTIQLGVFDPTTGMWQLDRNGNDVWEGCTVDICRGPYGKAGDQPVVGAWKTGALTDNVGFFRDKGTVMWRLDANGNGVIDKCTVDGCSTLRMNKSRAVAGDWTGTGNDNLGVFEPGTGKWKLDRNGNKKLDKCTMDSCLGPFGLGTDLPVAGDWNGSGTAKIGVFDPTTGLWELDLNGNGLFDGCQVDRCFGPFGQKDDVPVVGNW